MSMGSTCHHISVNMTSDKPKTLMRTLEDVHPQKMLLNPSLIPSLDPYFSQNLLDILASSVLPPFLEGSASQCEMAFLPSPGSLFNILSLSGSMKDSYRDDSEIPGTLDVFLIPMPGQNGKAPFPLHGSSAAPDCGPDSEDVHHSTIHLTNDHISVFKPTHLLTQEAVAGFEIPPISPVQPSAGKSECDKPIFEGVPEEAVKERIQWHLARQAALQNRALELQRTLQIQIGHHTVQHYSHQLDELLRHCQTETVSFDSLSPEKFLPSAGSKLCFPEQESSGASSYWTELLDFGHSSTAALRHLQESLDSEATATSSSDEEPADDRFHTGSNSQGSSSCEMRWLEERAELGSRWSWLQLQMSELHERIKQLGELHQCIRANKCGVVLAECQPLTDRQIQQTLLTDVAGLSCAALDQDNEYCCPALLLQNIERQSAELNYIVNSLKSPLSFSPLSKQKQTQKGKRRFTSGKRRDRVFVLGSSRRWRRDVSWVCARTRPLVTYHKPKLFTFSTCKPQDSKKYTFINSCSWDPTALHCDPDSCFTRTLSSSFSPQPVLSRSVDTPLSCHIQHTLFRNEWTQRSSFSSAQLSSSEHNSSTTLHSKEEEADILHQLYNPVRSSHDVLEKSDTESSQVVVHSFQDECDYKINTMVPESQTKVDKLHHKDIPTPSWRVVNTKYLMKMEAEDEGQVEVLTDEVFAQRHLELEQKLQWCSGSRHHKRRIGVYSSAVKSSRKRSSAQLETHHQLVSEEYLPQAQWERRVFPLDDEGEALLFSSSERVLSHCVSSLSKNI
ncbi:KAT8 regulatory NSL complex subunit 1-like protein isoform X2 [Thalassophryne amazonica]|uniref:KAT8 regulatory NSL complex subunit 1-like protein isoform X2 n=1 Tax=Thalassophryne amazonica TaxID=390379 RepID=UPI001471F78F|nr:KAT8 regulatory NSL complex subunit 1-like protein isoform X2 [Thalassophryne amazonica]